MIAGWEERIVFRDSETADKRAGPAAMPTEKDSKVEEEDEVVEDVEEAAEDISEEKID